MSDFIKREDATAVIRKTLGSLGNSVVTEINSLPGYATQDYARFTQDLISREDAIETVGDWMVKEFGYLDLNRGERLIDAFEALPSADRPTGRWVRKEKEINDCDGHRAYYWYECDNCGARPPKDQWGHEWHSDFCPNCGCAKMEGGDTE